MRSLRSTVGPLLMTLWPVATLLSISPVRAAATASTDSLVPALDHIIVVVMENKSYDQVRSEPYTAGLIAGSASFSSSYAITHPSQPNYIAMWAGSTLGVTNNTCPAPGSPFLAENLGHACEAAGLAWRAYSEDLPAVGSPVCTANGTLYTRKHAPWTHFANLDHANERPYGDLAADIGNGTLPNLAFVVPNNCHNTHDTGCTIAGGDTWLSQNLPAMIDAVGANGLVVLTWDEDNNLAGNHILTVFAGPRVLAGYVSPTPITHYTLLRTLCVALGIAPFGAAVQETAIGDVWIRDIAVQTLPWDRVKLLYR